MSSIIGTDIFLFKVLVNANGSPTEPMLARYGLNYSTTGRIRKLHTSSNQCKLHALRLEHEVEKQGSCRIASAFRGLGRKIAIKYVRYTICWLVPVHFQTVSVPDKMATSMNLRRVLPVFVKKHAYFQYNLPPSAVSSCKLRFLSTSPEVEVEYPPVRPKWPPGMGNWDGRLLPNTAWTLHARKEELLGIPVVKERLEKMAERLNYLWRVTPWELSTASLPYMQYITKTHVLHGLPTVYQDLNVDAVYDQVRSAVTDVLVQEHEQHRVFERWGLNTKPCDRTQRYGVHSVMGHIVRSILACTSADHQHLLRSQLDEDVDVKTFWKRHGFDAEKVYEDHDPEKPARLRGRWEGLLTMQYMHNADFQVRTELPLPQVSIPKCKFPL